MTSSLLVYHWRNEFKSGLNCSLFKKTSCSLSAFIWTHAINHGNWDNMPSVTIPCAKHHWPMTISRFYIHTTVTFIAFGINHVIKRMILAERKQKILPHCIVSPNWTNTAYYVTAETISTFKRSEVYKFICFLLNVEFSNACRFRVFQCHFSTVSRFPFPRFQSPQCWHGRTEYWKLPAFLPNIQTVVTIFRADNVFVRF